MMDVKTIAITALALSIIAIIVAVAALSGSTGEGIIPLGPSTIKYECSDKKDNDLDGKIDMSDAGCSSRTDNDETNCGDGRCEGGEICSSCVSDCGACSTTTTIPNSCSDTDGGWNVNLKGTVSGYYGGSPYSLSDFCLPSNTTVTMLNEYYCSGGRYYSGTWNCANVNATTTACVDGACI